MGDFNPSKTEWNNICTKYHEDLKDGTIINLENMNLDKWKHIRKLADFMISSYTCKHEKSIKKGIKNNKQGYYCKVCKRYYRKPVPSNPEPKGGGS